MSGVAVLVRKCPIKQIYVLPVTRGNLEPERTVLHNAIP
jgi:hypothetical protein